MYFKFKYDYAKLPRKRLTTTINTELLTKLKTLSVQIDQPISKLYDVLIMQLFENEQDIHKFIQKVKQY